MKANDLRNSILMMAIQGKLVEQKPHDESASILLEKIRAEKAELIKQKKIKKEKALPEITEEEKPFDLPNGWDWVRVGNIVSILSDGIHGTPNYKMNGEYYFINGNNLLNGKIVVKDNTKSVDYGEFEKHKKILDDTTVLVSINGTLGNVAFYQNEKIILGKSACYFNLLGNIEKKYIAQVIKSKYFLDYAFFIATGTTIKNVSLRAMKMFLMPLPPLQEQQRIVAKLEELMPKIDKYEHAETTLTSFEQEFPDKMRSSILQAAVQGKLVAQNPQDEPASVLLERIRAEKTELIKQKKIKKEKPLPEITEEEKPFDLPEGWEWVRLGKICNYGQNESSVPQLLKKGVWLLDLEDIEKNTGKIVQKKVVDGNNANSNKNIFYRGNVLYSKLRPYLNKAVIASEDGYCTSEILPLDFGKFIYNGYAKLVMTSPLFVNYAVGCSYGTKMPRLGTNDAKRFIFPLPPLNEQKNIVDKVEELLVICERL